MSYQNYGFGYPSDPNHGLPMGWIARFHEQTKHWFYVHQDSGRTQWERPGYESGYIGPQGQNGGQYGGQQGYGSEYVDERGYHRDWEQHQSTYTHSESSSYTPPQEPPKKNHNMMYGALGVGAGVLGGIFVAHEAGKVEEHFERDKYRFEEDFDEAKYAVEDVPGNIAGWAGRKVGDAEYDVERVKNDIEDFPENAAGWVGRRVGDVEGDFERVEDSYDYNRDEARYERRDEDSDDY